MPGTLSKQRGISLVVGMIMLLVITLLVVSAFNSSETNLKVVGNMQMRQEAQSSAHQAIEATIGTTVFFQNRSLVMAAPVQIDVNGDGSADHVVSVTPDCFRHAPVATTSLNVANPADKPCFGTGANQNSGIFTSGGGGSSASLCADTWWNIQAVVNDAATGAQARMHQGVTVRVPRTDAENNCN
jgi:Tfp pilus assembly protein PilX